VTHGRRLQRPPAKRKLRGSAGNVALLKEREGMRGRADETNLWHPQMITGSSGMDALLQMAQWEANR